MLVMQDDVVVIVLERGIRLIPNWQDAAHVIYKELGLDFHFHQFHELLQRER